MGQGNKTREHQKAEINGQVETKGVDVNPDQRPLSEARAETEQPAGEYEISSGDRSIQRGANQASEHHKKRDD
jgi:hypothetical protein